MIPKEELLTKYLFTECLRPQRIVNPYSHDVIFAPCGHCKSCIMNKSNFATAYAMNMATHFKYCYFVTLTYKDIFLPYLSVEVVRRSGNRYLFDENFETMVSTSDPRLLTPEYYHDRDLSLDPAQNEVEQVFDIGFQSIPRDVSVKSKGSFRFRSFDDEPLKFCIPMKLSELQDILIKANGRYDYGKEQVVYPSLADCKLQIPVLQSRDIELFFKRLRRNLDSHGFTSSKICYYVVSEYGPQTYRPHWHCLLFFDSEEITKTLREDISKAWSYGRIDYSLSRGAAASYVASYVNSAACLPFLYVGQKEIRPRSFHSKGFGSNKIFPKSSDVSEISKISDLFFDGVNIDSNGKVVNVRPVRSCELAVFPRFSNDFFSDSDTCCKLFQSVIKTPERLVSRGYLRIDTPSFGSDDFRLSDLVRAYSEYYERNFTDFSFSLRFLRGYRTRDYADELIFREARLFDGYVCNKDMIFGRLYRLFAKVLRCFKFWNLKQYTDSWSLKSAIKKIWSYGWEYWKKKEYRFLTTYFEYLEGCNDDERLFLLVRTSGSGLATDSPHSWTYTQREDYVNCLPDDLYKRYMKTLKWLTARTETVLKDKVKHKEFNDMQGVLLFSD